MNLSNWWKTDETKKTHKRRRDEFDDVTGSYGDVIKAGISDNSAYVRNILKEEGTDTMFEVIQPKDNQLFIDYDQADLPKRFEEAMDFLVQTFCGFGERLTYRITQSRHGNLHVIIDLPRAISELERLAWHGVFESDWKRSASALMCMRRGVKNNTLLIERRDTPPLATGQRMFRRENNGDSVS
jgi:hypothetical protein